MNITTAQYGTNIEGENNSIIADVDGISVTVPLDPNNRHYAEIMRLVDAGELTIADAE